MTKIQTYKAYLFQHDQLIDETSIDENSIELAEYLFYGEFEHKRTNDSYITIESDIIEEIEEE